MLSDRLGPIPFVLYYYSARSFQVKNNPKGTEKISCTLKRKTRVIYDRVLNEKNYFEFPAFFMFEQGKSRGGNSK